MKAGIIGLGTVGMAVKAGIKPGVITYFGDLRPDLNAGEDPFDTDVMFICLPTPNDKNGQDNLAIENTLCALEGYKGVIILKSTVLPGYTDHLKSHFPKLNIVHNPEFLTAKNASRDFIHQKVILLSGKMEDCSKVIKFHEEHTNCLIETAQVSEDHTTTEWAKYIHNCSLSIKLSFLNEIYNEIQDPETYSKAAHMAYFFGNLGNHWKVPGPDGKLGFGGACFPKDMEALSTHLKINNTVSAAIKTNKAVRGE